MEFLKFIFPMLIALILLLATKKYVKPKNGQFEMVYQVGYKIIAILGLCMFLFSIADLFSWVGKQTVSDWRVSAFLGLLAIPFSLEALVSKIVFNDHFLVVRSPWSGVRKYRWSDIHGVSHSTLLTCEVILLNNGRRIHLFEGLIGTESLLAKIRSELQREEDEILYL